MPQGEFMLAIVVAKKGVAPLPVFVFLVVSLVRDLGRSI
jgi:hypothetical protein